MCALDEVVLHALEKEPERRYQQASELKTDLEAIAGTTAMSEGRNQKSAVDQPPGLASGEQATR